MSWQLRGRYAENCSCEAVCPCTWSGLSAKATSDRCNFVLVMHIDDGDLDGVDVGGLTFALVGDTPALMSEGNWRMGVYVDERADDAQRAKLTALVSGELGGPPAMLAPLIGEMLGLEFAPIEFESEGGSHRIRIGDAVDFEVVDFVPPGSPTGEAVTMTGIVHPAASTLTVAPASRSRVDAFGVSFPGEGRSGFSAPFTWAA
jgi:hypothetical protein